MINSTGLDFNINLNLFLGSLVNLFLEKLEIRNQILVEIFEDLNILHLLNYINYDLLNLILNPAETSKTRIEENLYLLFSEKLKALIGEAVFLFEPLGIFDGPENLVVPD